MLIYWLLFAFPAIGALVSVRDQHRARGDVGIAILFMAAFWLLYSTVSALRFNVGADWYNYSRMVEVISNESLSFALGYGDMGFTFMIWLFNQFGIGIYGINGLCSMILVTGVIATARKTPDPWLAIAAATPYLLIVVGLGYIRQGAAIGFILLGINAFTDRRMITGLAMFVLATMFHVASIVVLPVIGLAVMRRNFVGLVGTAVVGLGVWAYLLTDQRVQTFQVGYIDTDYNSGGAGIRLVMNLVPATLFLLRRNVLDLEERERAIWTNIAIASILCFLAYYLSPSSTAVDRVALFFSPIQVFMFGWYLRALKEEGRTGAILIIGALSYCALVQFVWLFYATHAEYWVPYRSIFDRVEGV
jgi:hypothetical protein